MRHAGCHSIETRVVETRVVDKRWRDGRNYRVRKCLKCGERFKTFEVTEEEFMKMEIKVENIEEKEIPVAETPHSGIRNSRIANAEFDQPVWAVVTSRGVRAIDIPITEAWKIADGMGSEDHGLAIVTAEAARRMNISRAGGK